MDVMYLHGLLLVLLLLESVFSLKRNKRVINGMPFNGRPNTYSVIEYYGVLATRHSIPFYTFGFRPLLKNTGIYGKVICSGSLLLPMIFQTACHCLADFDKSTIDFVKRPLLKDSWEQSSVVYVGVSNRFGNESMVTYSPLLAEEYVIHRQCGGIGEADSATYDYGLVILNSSWSKVGLDGPFPWTKVGWAPVYKAEVIKDFYRFALKNQLVCLLVGFGEAIADSAAPTDELLHGWVNLVSQKSCVQTTTQIKGITVEFLKNNISWVCTQPFPNHDHQSGAGDSGGPLTCGNTYFGIVSGKSKLREDKTNKILVVVTKHHALVHNLFTNAIDFREDLIEDLNKHPKPHRDTAANLRLVGFKSPRFQEILFLKTISPASHHTSASMIIVLCSILFQIID